MALTKTDIIEEIITGNGFTRKKSAETVEILLEIIKKTLASGEVVLVGGFGKFCVKQKNERRGRNPATGEDMMLAPRGLLRLNVRRGCGREWGVEVLPIVKTKNRVVYGG